LGKTPLRRLARAPARILPRVLPASPAGRLIDRWPTLLRFLPPRKEFLSRKYLSNYVIQVDTAFSIEYQMLSGAYCPRVQHFIKKYARPGAVCFDVGANVGAITLGLAQMVSPGGKVFAFEPGPYCTRLVANLRLNPALADLVVPCRLGLGDRAGSLFWAEDPAVRGNGILRPQGEVEVPVVTLDQFFREQKLSRLDFLKIDVNGLDHEVLVGARETIQAHRPVIYYGTHADWAALRGDDVLQKTAALLRSCGYSLYKFGPDYTPIKTTAADLDPDSTLALPD
jgi:FkbM family methyltransferase